MTNMILQFKRFTRPQVLKGIEREWLGQFLGRFADELRERSLALPGPQAGDDEYFGALARLFSSPEALPDELTEALFAIDEMATPEGQEQLEAAVARAGLAIAPCSSSADLAMQVWLADPALLARQHNQQRLLRLTAFEHFGSTLTRCERRPFITPGPEALKALAADLDAWFERHQRGRDTVRLQGYDFQGEFWCLIRHGDNFARTPRVEAQRTEVIHFRPEKDDVVIYSPSHDEIRINSRTKGERDLYVREFGRRLRGREDYFSRKSTYTLEPLRREGLDALDPAGLEGIERIVLRALEVAWDFHPLRPKTIHQAEDLFACPPRGGGHLSDELLPADGRLTRAAFDVWFTDAPKPRPVQIRLPNVLKLGRHCDLRLIDGWLCKSKFRQ